MKTLLDALDNARVGRSSSIRCPAHEDKAPSLSVRPASSDGWLRVKCFKGCSREDILGAVGLSLSDIGPDRPIQIDRPLRHPRPVLTAAEADERAAKRTTWPKLERPTAADLEAIANIRGIPVHGLTLAAERDLLRVADYRNSRAWVVTDASRRAAQARRLDGQPWTTPTGQPKALTLPGSLGAWPVGLAAVRPEHRAILLCEGGPDLLAAHVFVSAENRQTDAAAVAMLGASARISDDAIPVFKGRRVRIIAHADEAGAEAVRRWGSQLHEIAESLEVLTLGTLQCQDGAPVKDLNDALHVDPDTFESARALWALTP